MIDAKILCTNCNGTGRINQYIMHSRWNNEEIFFKVNCPKCGGLGWFRYGSKRWSKAIKEASRE